LVWDLDDAIKEVNLLGEHEEESSQKITELEAVCKRLREDAQRLKEERTSLEGMILPVMSRSWIWLKSMDSTAWERTMMMRMRMTMMKGTPSHPQHRRPLPCLRRSSKKKTRGEWSTGAG
jgi:hypothetical protein